MCECGKPLHCKGKCRNCYQREYMRTWRKRPGEQAKHDLRQFRKRHVGLVERPTGACAICDRTDMPLQVDHDHSCCPAGRSCPRCRRGSLCNSCNRALGWLQDDPSIVQRAAEYLRARKLAA